MKKVMWFFAGLFLPPCYIILYVNILSFFPVTKSLQSLYAILFLLIIISAIILTVKQRKRNKYFSIGIWLSFILILFMIFFPSYQGVQKYTRAKEYFNKGLVCYKQNNLNQAISDFTKAIETYPRFYDAYINRGDIYKKQGNFSLAIFDYTKAINIGYNLAEPYYSRSVAYFHLNGFTNALNDVHRAEKLGAKIDPKFLEELKKATSKQTTQQQNLEVWEKWYQGITGYVDYSKELLDKNTQALNKYKDQLVKAKSSILLPAEKKKRINAIKLEAEGVMSQLKDKFSVVKPPVEFENYHKDIIQAFEAQANFIAVAAKRGNVYQPATQFVVDILRAEEELNRIFIVHNAPQDYIDSNNVAIEGICEGNASNSNYAK